MNKSKIFISYSHRDKEWKELLVKHLEVLEPEGRYQLWDDSKIGLGRNWLQEIEKAMDDADAAVMMVSADFLTSNFILNKEVPSLMERQQNEGLIVIPFIVKPCAWEKVSWLSPIQAAPEDGTPLIEGGEFEIEKKLADFARKLFDLMGGEEKTITGTVNMRRTVLLTDLPQKNIKLIGRDQELQMLAERLKETDQILLLNGLGGVGKTEVCKRFFLDHYKQFSAAGWIDYVSSIKESTVAGIKTNKVEFNEGDTLDERFEKVMAFLKTLDENSLLVIDNIEDPEDEHLGTIKTLPFKVIATSRLTLEGVEAHALDFLSAQNCKDLFYTYYEGDMDDEYVEKIIDRCGKHTLTVELLARTAQNAAIPIKDLYTTLEKEGFNLNEVIGDKVHTFWHNEKERKEFFNHLLRIFDLSNVTEAEMAILINISVLPAVYISIKNFSEWLELKSKEDINSLVRKGWLRKSGFTIFMHQVIQEVIRYKKPPDSAACERLITSLANKLSLEPRDNPFDKKEYVIFADTLMQHIDDNDLELARLSNNLSIIYYKALGHLKQALEFQEKTMKIREKVLDKNNPSLATSYNNLAEIHRRMGQPKQALGYQEKAVTIWENVLEKDLPLLAAGYNNLSLIYKDLGQLEQALEFQEKAVEIFEKILAENNHYLAISYDNLSMLYLNLDRFEPAMQFQEKALKIGEKVLDTNHPDLANFYNNSSLIYKALGKPNQALEFQLKALNIREEVLDKNHHDLATSYNNLSLIYKDLGQPKQALKFQLKAIAIREEVLDKNHPDLANSYHNLSAIYHELKDYKKAVLYAQQAVAILQYLFPNGHPNLDTAKESLERIKRMG